MKDTAPLYEPSSAMGHATGYLARQWQRLTVATDDAAIPIHNNESESALRIIAMARKSSLFFGNDKAAERLVILYSLVRTCERNGVNPEVYFRDILMRLRAWPPERLADLLPHRWKERFGSGFATAPRDDAPRDDDGDDAQHEQDNEQQDAPHKSPPPGDQQAVSDNAAQPSAEASLRDAASIAASAPSGVSSAATHARVNGHDESFETAGADPHVGPSPIATADSASGVEMSVSRGATTRQDVTAPPGDAA